MATKMNRSLIAVEEDILGRPIDIGSCQRTLDMQSMLLNLKVSILSFGADLKLLTIKYSFSEVYFIPKCHLIKERFMKKNKKLWKNNYKLKKRLTRKR
jgi:hypothetical protein